MESRPAAAHGPEGPTLSTRRLALLGIGSAVLFALGLVVTEAFGEFGVDIDFKPFVLPYILLALFRYGLPSLSIGLGAALGEGLLDVVEGYELDDPLGFLGYVVGFTVFAWYLHESTADPTRTRSLVIAAVLGAFVQALFEGVAFLLLTSPASAKQAAFSVVGNTVTHGVVLGAIPLVVVLPWLRSWLDENKWPSLG